MNYLVLKVLDDLSPTAKANKKAIRDLVSYYDYELPVLTKGINLDEITSFITERIKEEEDMEADDYINLLNILGGEELDDSNLKSIAKYCGLDIDTVKGITSNVYTELYSKLIKD